MKKIILASALSVLALSAQASTYEIDSNHANARFAIDHFGTTTNTGGFYGLTGEVEFDAAKKTGFVGITIPVASLDTGNKHFTDHLKSDDFFNAAKYPTMYFKSTKLHFKGDKLDKVDGELTLLGKTNPVTLTATKFNCYDSPMLKTQVCGGDFETTIDRTQWGMDTYVKMGVAKDVKINIQIEAGKKAEAAQAKPAATTATATEKTTEKTTEAKSSKLTKKIKEKVEVVKEKISK